MTREHPDAPTQKTPKGYTIPVPSREDVERALEKVARPSEPRKPRRSRRRK